MHRLLNLLGDCTEVNSLLVVDSSRIPYSTAEECWKWPGRPTVNKEAGLGSKEVPRVVRERR